MELREDTFQLIISSSQIRMTTIISLGVYPSIHRSMGSAPVGAQCPLTSSQGELLGYRDWLWYPGLCPCWCPSPFPSPSISLCFLFTLLHQPLDFIRLFLRWRYLHPPPTLLLIPGLGLSLW